MKKTGVFYHDICGKEAYSRKLDEWAFWLVAVGMATMWGDLLAAGLLQGFNWWGMVHFMDVVRNAVPFWFIRTLTGVAIFSGILCYVANMVLTITRGRGAAATPELQPTGGVA